jgi:hypothetical protein
VAWFGEQIVEVKQLSSFSCRRIGGSGSMSEHGYGNALDVAGFTLQGGRTITVKHGWRGAPDERGFLRQVHAGGCEVFTTVLGPGYDAAHHDHFHFDLARRNNVVCRPTPELLLPPPGTPRQHYDNVPVAQRQQQQQQRFPVARLQPQSDYDDDHDEPQVQRFPVARQKNQPITPDQAYPPPPSQQRTVNQPMVINPQNPGNYPPPGNQQYLQAPNAPPHVQQPQQQPQMQWQQGPQPAPYNPNRPVPPQRVGSKANADQTVTGSIKNRKYYKETPEPKKNLPKAVPGED